MDFIKNPKSTVGMQKQFILSKNKIRIPVDKDAIIKKQGCFASIL
jgi:hypothetical protein